MFFCLFLLLYGAYIGQKRADPLQARPSASRDGKYLFLDLLISHRDHPLFLIPIHFAAQVLCDEG